MYWPRCLENIYAKYHIPDDAKYNLDEKGIMMGVAGRSKVLVKKGTRLHAVYQDTNREMVTMVEYICSDGTVAPPLMIFKGASHYYRWYPKEIKGSNYTFGYSPNGYIDHVLLFLWLRDIFHPAMKSKIANYADAWRLLIYDGHESHLNLEVLEFCYESKILVFCLPSHVIHILCLYLLNLSTQLQC